MINFGADPIGGGVVRNHCSRETVKKTGICYLKFHLVATHFNLNAILFFGYFVYAVVIRSFYFSIMVLILLPSKKEKRRVNYIFGAISFDGVLLG